MLYATPKNRDEAEATAIQRRKDNSNLNFNDETEYAFSPSTFAVGMRNWPGEPFRVFNVNYPMYGKSDQVQDWVSVGQVRSKKPRIQ